MSKNAKIAGVWKFFLQFFTQNFQTQHQGVIYQPVVHKLRYTPTYNTHNTTQFLFDKNPQELTWIIVALVSFHTLQLFCTEMLVVWAESVCVAASFYVAFLKKELEFENIRKLPDICGNPSRPASAGFVRYSRLCRCTKAKFAIC